MSDHARVLVADDEASIRFVLRETLESAGHEVVDVDGRRSRAARDRARATSRSPSSTSACRGRTASSCSTVCGRIESDVAVVIITAQNTFENAVEAMKRGALDYLAKPFSTEEVLPLVDKALRTRALESEVQQLRREVSALAQPGERLVGGSPAMLEVFKTVGRVARGDVAVLITGESGTGKELVARAIHAAGPRAEQPFVAVNAAAIPRELLESELFGHERGAFTGAVESRPGRFREASGGTLFLDEIGDMPVDLQAKILRALQEQEVTSVGGKQPIPVDVRVVAATHQDLDVAVREGRFREDLLYRLRVVPIHMPPLRDRRDDIPLLVEHFLGRYEAELADRPLAMPPDTMARLGAHDWPGNVRELENAIKRALVLAGSDVLSPEDFGFLHPGPSEGGGGDDLEATVVAEAQASLREDEPEVYRRLIPRVEKALLETVLRETLGNQIKAAALLGINRNTLRKKIVDLEIEVPSRP